MSVKFDFNFKSRLGIARRTVEVGFAVGVLLLLVLFYWSVGSFGNWGTLNAGVRALRSRSSFIMSFLSHSEGVMPSCAAW